MAEKTSSLLCENLNFAGKEAFKRLRTNIIFSFADGKENHIIGVTSVSPSDGKSLTSINLAYSLYELGKRVLLVDADMRRPSISSKLEVRKAPGLSELLVTTNDVASCVLQYRKGEKGTLDILPSGKTPPNPSELLNSSRMGLLMEKLPSYYDYIIVDLPPVGAVTDAQIISGLTDGIILVARENHSTCNMLDDCISQLKLANAKILGFVLNGAVEGAKKSYHSGYYYG